MMVLIIICGLIFGGGVMAAGNVVAGILIIAGAIAFVYLLGRATG
jgi:hypothetical protein